jgi:succinate dehydrogenase / fumarate reductase membrane anchor subunit
MKLRHPIARARGIGSAQGGVEHWWAQRWNSLVLMVLTPWFLWLVLSNLDAGQAEMRLLLAQPWNTALMLVFVGMLFWHAMLGLQVVIEDYVHTQWAEWTLHLVNRFVWLLATLASVVAIGRIAFGA